MSNIKTRISGEQIIDGSITRQNLDTSIVSDIDVLKENDLSKAEDISTLQSDVVSLGSDLTTEQTARAAADTALGLRVDDAEASISAESSRAQAAEGALQDGITAEATAREAADTALQNNINAEVSAREAADNALQAGIDGEAAARSAEDLTLLKLDGSRAMTGDLDLGGGYHKIVSVQDDRTMNLAANKLDMNQEGVWNGNAYRHHSEFRAGIHEATSVAEGKDSRVWYSASGIEFRSNDVNNLAPDFSGAELRNLKVDAANGKIELSTREAVLNGDGQVSDTTAKYKITMENGKITLMDESTFAPVLPVNAQDVAVKAYVDLEIASLSDSAVAAVGAETAAREAADGNLQDQIDALSISVSSDAGDLAAEILDRQNSDLALSGRLDVLEQDPTTKTYVDQKVADLVNSAPAVLDTLKELADAIGDDPNFAATVANQVGVISADLASEVAAREAAVSAEAAAREAADTTLQSNIDAEAAARAAADTTLQSNIDAEAAAREAAVSAEAAARAAADTTLQSNIDAEAAARAAAVSAEAAARAAADTTLQNNINAEAVARAAADTTLQNNINSEASTRAAADTALDTRVIKVEDLLGTPVDAVFENNAAVYADGRPGVVDPSAALRDGWYFQNSTAGHKVNWYFFDGQANNITLANFSAYAVVTVDSLTSLPFMVVYTATTGSGDATAWFKSSRVFYMPSAGTVVGKKYLIYVGQNPNVHPELPHLQCTPGTQVGTYASTERVGTAAFSTNSGAAVNNVKLIVDRLGAFSATYKQEIALRIRSASQVSLDAEAAARAAADTTLQSNINSEASARQAADTALQTSINSEASARAAADTALQNNINSEASARQAADSSLSARIDSLESSGNETSGDLAQEIADRIAGDASTLSSANSYTDGKVADLVNSAPAVLDTLKELADALGQDPNFATTVANQVGDVVADLAAEISRAQAAETALSGSVSALDTRIAALEAVTVVTREVPSGLINGANTVFTLGNTPMVGSEQVFLNGLLQQEGVGGDYTISAGTITFAEAPKSGFALFVSYIKN